MADVWKEELRKLCFKNDLDLFGVGPVERWKGEPVGHRPTDVLPGAKSVIVVGIAIPEGCIKENMMAYRGEHNGILPYLHQHQRPVSRCDR